LRESYLSVLLWSSLFRNLHWLAAWVGLTLSPLERKQQQADRWPAFLLESGGSGAAPEGIYRRDAGSLRPSKFEGRSRSAPVLLRLSPISLPSLAPSFISSSSPRPARASSPSDALWWPKAADSRQHAVVAHGGGSRGRRNWRAGGACGINVSSLSSRISPNGRISRLLQ
jgi:hypothetical protein